MDKSIVIVQKEIAPLIKKATALEIKNSKDMETATEVLSQMNLVMDRITEIKEKVTKPLLQALAAERARWSPIEKDYKPAVEDLRGKISVYQTEQMRLARLEEERIAKLASKGKLSIETAVDKIENIKRTPNEIETKSGTLKFRESKVLKITNLKKIPHKYFMVDEKALMMALEAGIKVEGAEIEKVMVPVNSR